MKLMTERSENCSGCDVIESCSIPPSWEDAVCPCSICLIKIMCKTAMGCHLYTHYKIRKLKSWWKENNS
jgi:hypothetical protein